MLENSDDGKLEKLDILFEGDKLPDDVSFSSISSELSSSSNHSSEYRKEKDARITAERWTRANTCPANEYCEELSLAGSILKSSDFKGGYKVSISGINMSIDELASSNVSLIFKTINASSFEENTFTIQIMGEAPSSTSNPHIVELALDEFFPAGYKSAAPPKWYTDIWGASGKSGYPWYEFLPPLGPNESYIEKPFILKLSLMIQAHGTEMVVDSFYMQLVTFGLEHRTMQQKKNNKISKQIIC